MRKRDIPPKTIPWRERPFVLLAEACELVPCSMSKLYELVERGEFRLFKVDRTSVIETAGIVRFHAGLPEGRLTGIGRYGVRDREGAEMDPVARFDGAERGRGPNTS